MKYLVGTFNDEQLRNGVDKIAITKAQQETGFKFIEAKMVKIKGVYHSRVWVVKEFPDKFTFSVPKLS